MIPDEAKGTSIEIWFRVPRPSGQDEAPIGQKGTPASVWARQGNARAPCRIRAIPQPTGLILSLSKDAAVCPQRGVGAGLVMPRANTEGPNAHLIEIARSVAPGAHAVPIMDGAAGTRATISSSRRTSSY